MTDASRPWNFHHVGFVVEKIDDSVTALRTTLRATWTGNIFVDPLQRVRVTFLQVTTGQAMLELVEPLGADSPVQRFLSENGGGLHHMCYEVSDIELELAHVRRCGGIVVSRPKPAVAFGGRRIAWILSSSGLLVEFLEESTEGLDRSVPSETVRYFRG
ncbi:MAG: VOC family protein [Pseudomonadota bacterium]|jgi:methylmalonyl-CoA/ethylmalonyl-CoA epimerase|nr:VOC family protein [Pseudomonadota bacterium]